MAGISGSVKCRFYHAEIENPSHLVSEFNILPADGHYTALHNKICKCRHWKVCKEHEINVNEKIWDHEPDSVTSNGNNAIFYNKEIPSGM